MVSHLSTDLYALEDEPPIPPTTPAGRHRDNRLEIDFGAPNQRPLNRLSHSGCQGEVVQMCRAKSSGQEDAGQKARV